MAELIDIVAEMICGLGYDPFIWYMFGHKYKLIQVNPVGVLIEVRGGTEIVVGVEFKAPPFVYGGGIKLDLADPSTTEEKLAATIMVCIHHQA
jgi:hypothetical protein